MSTMQQRDGHLLLQDAAALLTRFMVGDMPDRALFKFTVGELVANAAATHRRVRVFGEMVDLLWRSNLPAAICLEHLWNELLEESNLSLFCAYAANQSTTISPRRCARPIHISSPRP